MMNDDKDSWWPTPLAHVPKTDFVSEKNVIVSEISEGAKSGLTRDLHLALLEPGSARDLTECRERLPFSYMPGTGLQADKETMQLEPLAVKWQGGCNHYVQVPSLGILEHFGLVPRPVDSALVWDDLEKPLRDIVHSEMVSEYDYPSMRRAVIQIRREYLLAYAEATERAIVALWYERNSGPNTDYNGEPNQESYFGTHEFPGRRIEFGLSPIDDNVVVAEFWGILPVYFPTFESTSV